MNSLALMMLSMLLLQASEPTTENTAKTVLGSVNPDLTAGADALKAGDAELGIQLTRRGLEFASSRRERQAALSNLCAGYVMIEDYRTALAYCDEALADNSRNWRALSNRALIYVKTGRYEDAKADLDVAQGMAPNAVVLKTVRGMLLDETEPVSETITIDDRREAGRSIDDTGVQ